MRTVVPFGAGMGLALDEAAMQNLRRSSAILGAANASSATAVICKPLKPPLPVGVLEVKRFPLNLASQLGRKPRSRAAR